jgi:checkpoint serine/threonine-protein kinase
MCAAAEAFVPEGLQPCFEDDEMVEQYAPNGENCDPLPPHDELARPAAPARSSVDGAALQPLSPAFYAASVSDGVEDDVDADAAERVLDAEAALRDASSAEALAAQDSFKVYEDEEPETCASVEPAAFTLEAAGTAAPAAPAALVDAFSPAALEHNMASLEEPVAVMQGVTVEDESTAAKLEASLSAARRHPHSGVVLQLGGYRYIMGKLCGRGAFADIYEAVDEDDADSGDEGHAPAPALALKVVRPPDAVAVSWEFVVLRRVAARVAPLERQLFLQARRLHMAGPHSVLVAPFGSHGTLQDAVNAAMGTDRVGAMHESLAMYFTVELLRCLEVLHAAGFIHADVKPDNVLLRNGGAAWEEWTPDRPGDWRLRGLALIDFGRSIDLTTHVPGTAFVGDCGTDNFRCIEMQTHAPWTFQADTFGALGCVHAMLWGSYMDVDCDTGSGRWRRRASMKRYWHAELWEPLFDALLNVPSCDAQPPLSSFRAAFEAHLAAPERALEVRAQLMELTILMHEQAAKAAK